MLAAFPPSLAREGGKKRLSLEGMVVEMADLSIKSQRLSGCLFCRVETKLASSMGRGKSGVVPSSPRPHPQPPSGSLA